MSPRRFVAPALLAAALIAPGHAAPDRQPETIEGQLLTLWLDAPAGIAAPAPEHWLYRRGGDRVQLDVPAALRGVVLGLDRKPVRLRGRARPAAAGGPARLEVQHAQPAPAGAGATLAAWPEDATRGRRPWVNLLCAFPDASGEQRDPGFFTSMFSSTRPGLDYYWKELSNGQLSVAGTRTFGWYTLPQPHATYVRDGNLDFQLALNDCTGVADADVDFLDYSGVNLVFNASLGCCAWGGGGFVSRDGDTRIVGVTWMPDWAWPHHGVFGHEMGHGLGLPHSRSTYNVYGNPWDVMSDLWFNCHLATDPVIGCLGQHTIGYHKDRLGWVPDTARVTLAPGETRSVQLDKLERPTAGMHHLAVIPIHGSSGHYYTVEARRKYGFDAKLPGASIVIHEVDTTRGEPAQVVDADGNATAHDGGSRWLVGETFSDRRHGVRVSVDAAADAGFLVTLASTDVPLFADGFESGDVSAWGGGKLDGGDFAVTTAAAMEGSYGAAVTLDDNNQVHVTDHTPTGVTSYLARFRFNPNRVAMAAGERFVIFGGYTATASAVIVELRHYAAGYEIRALARLDDGAQLASPAVYLIDEYPYELQVEWQAATAAGANDGSMRFLINGQPYADYRDLDNDTLAIERALLGAVSGVDTGTRGTLFFDGFESRRW